MNEQLDELNDVTLDEGNDVNVLARQIPVTVGKGSLVFEIILWVCFLIPGLIFLIMKIKAKTYFRQLQQTIQANASTIDNYIVQRGEIMMNLAALLQKSIDLDKDTYTQIAAFRSGINPNADLNDRQAHVDNMYMKMQMAMERYPDLQAHADIRNAMQQNSYLQREITAARELYNDTVNRWNTDIFIWPTKQIAAASMKLKTRIPFAASKEEKARGRGNFFA